MYNKHIRKVQWRQKEGNERVWVVWYGLPEPEIVHLAVSFSISYEARAHFFQQKSAVGALEAGRVPLEVRRHTQDELIQDRAATPGTHACPSNS